LNNAFFKGQRRFLTITSDKHNTAVYLDGKKVKEYRNYSLTPTKELTPAWRIVMGNDPTGKRPWTGKIHGLALYNHSLSSEKVSEHFEKWRSESALSLLKGKDIIALYPMDEQSGNTIHNVVNDRYNLLIPDKFEILKKNFLQLSCNALKLDISTLRDVGINIIGFIPLGYFLFVYIFSIQSLKTPSWRLIILAILGGIAVSLIIEILQAYLPTRNSSLTDLIFNTFGTALGVISARIFKIKRPRSEDTAI
jgi:VanZ family protein